MVRGFGRRSWAALVLLALLGAVAGVPARADASARIAVVVGNGGYESPRLPDLPNAPRDAAALSRSLRQAGFTVIAATDVTGKELEALLARALAEKPSEALLFFYAGHAVAAGGETFLLPTDSPDPTSLARLTAGAWPLGSLIRRMADDGRATLIFLDACRTAPGASGLAVPAVFAGNVFVAFSAQPGQAAADGNDAHSPFARALLRHLGEPGLALPALMARVQAETARLTLGRQRPWSWSTLRGQFVFKAAAAATRPGG